MKKSMLIDAAHSEETRIVILENNVIEDIDFESTTKNQNKGNIYLAKISRVEPSLRAAFVDYGKDRHGFLPFSEIHPDYFQIPIADKEKLLASAAEENNINAAELDNKNGKLVKKKEEANEEEISFNEALNLKQASIRRSKLYSKYRIQEVIKKRLILLIQVTKEERGNKGAALTTFLSLAGRYCVLMPNSANSGGISKKIPFKIRNKMKNILNSLNIPKEMSVILRTAGSEKTKLEIKRDYEYLSKLWQTIKNKTLESIAPLLIHEENHIIKRALRDYFSSDFDEVLIEGDEGFKLGKTFMKTLMPSKVKLIKKYKENLPIFHNYGLEGSIDKIFNSEVNLFSGGSIVITPTEALVSIDVNSGRSTNERDIESTALKTNVEAAKEIAKQLRLRDLGGLIVIDFIDMNIRKNNFTVEKTIKSFIKKDRAKIQIGRISNFGLLEMSRQRLRPSLLEINYQTCKVCNGLGLIRSIESKSLQIIREIELLIKDKNKANIKLVINPKIAEFFLNKKNDLISEGWIDYNNKVEVIVDQTYNQNEYNIKYDIVKEDKFEKTDSKYLIENKKREKKLDKNKINKKNKEKNLSAKPKKEIKKPSIVKEKTSKPEENKKLNEKKDTKKNSSRSKVKKRSSTNKSIISSKTTKDEIIDEIKKPKRTGWWQG